jgi:predicted permease
VVSFALSEQLGGAAVVGKTLTIMDRHYSIVGVAPPRFQGLQAGRECDVWIPMSPPATTRGDRRFSVVGRLAPDVTLADAEEDVRRISADLAERHPETNRGRIGQPDAPRQITAIRYTPLDPAASSQVFLIGIVVGGASALLLASACLNAGSLLLSRAVARRHEFAVKMALGAVRGRLVRQVLTEALCLSIAGGALGLLFAFWTAGAIPALFMAEHAELLDTRLDARVVLLAIGGGCIAAALFGVAPALHGTASAATTALRADAGGVSGQYGSARLRALLVGAQVALSIVLLLTTGLLVMSLAHALEGDLGSSIRKVAFVTIELPGRFNAPVRGVAYRSTLLERLTSLGGVDAVGWASTLPLGRGNKRVFRIEAGTGDVTDTVELDTNVVTPGYFQALALLCVEGRLFDASDGALAPPVVVVDELLARRYFGPTAAGRQMVDALGARVTIVGVVRSGRYRTLQQAPQPTVYYSAAQDYLWRGHLVVRTAGDPAALLAAIEGTVRGAGEGGSILQTSTLETHLSDSLALDRLTTTLVGLCGVIALAMSAIGVYGVMTDAVQRRTREIGLRVALGAGWTHVARLVFMEAMYPAGAGLLIGATAALVLNSAARSFVYGVPSLTIVTLMAAAGALAAVVAFAAVLPLRSALRISPNIALRAE